MVVLPEATPDEPEENVELTETEPAPTPAPKAKAKRAAKAKVIESVPEVVEEVAVENAPAEKT